MQSFTLKSGTGLLRLLITDAYIYPENIPTKEIAVKAIWDTGATGCSITSAVVKALGLAPIDKAKVKTANGDADQNIYKVDIGLPSKTLVQGIRATESIELGRGCGALIGMDVITLCDFSITNHRGNTCMSFRIPSEHEIDYVKNPKYGS